LNKEELLALLKANAPPGLCNLGTDLPPSLPLPPAPRSWKDEETLSLSLEQREIAPGKVRIASLQLDGPLGMMRSQIIWPLLL
jgi:hypothetical protein